MSGAAHWRGVLLPLAVLAVSLVHLVRGAPGDAGTVAASLLLVLLGGAVLVGGVVWSIRRAGRVR